MSGYQMLQVAAESGIGIITINRPEVRNALSIEVVSELKKALDQFRTDDSVGVVIITGAGEKSFAAGADIRQLREKTFKAGLKQVWKPT